MATKRRGVRKGRIIVDTGQAGVKAYADVDLGDFEGLTKEVSKWTSAAEGSTNLGTVKGSNLLDAVQKHGVAQRERAKSPIGLEFSGKKIFIATRPISVHMTRPRILSSAITQMGKIAEGFSMRDLIRKMRAKIHPRPCC